MNNETTPPPGATGDALRPPSSAAVSTVWDAEGELAVDRRRERALLVRELVVLMLVAVLIVLREIFVHAS